MKAIYTATIFLLLTLVGAQASPLRVLLISGQNNHDWKSTTPVIKRFLEKSGGIEVTVTETPHQLTQADFNGTDVIVSNWNTYQKNAAVKKWPAVVRKAYADFVKNGGGHVGIHAGTSSFNDWEDYQAIGLMTWGSKTTHGKQHTFSIRIEKSDHPVTKGWKPKALRDELWRSPKVHPDATVLASSFSAKSDGGSESWEPCVFIGKFGRGRCFTTSLGHDAKSLSQPDVLNIILRGVQWVGNRL